MSETGGPEAKGPAAHRGESGAAGAGDVPGAPRATDGGPDEPPPILGRWSRLYLLVALELLAVILVLYWLTRRFA